MQELLHYLIFAWHWQFIYYLEAFLLCLLYTWLLATNTASSGLKSKQGNPLLFYTGVLLLLFAQQAPLTEELGEKYFFWSHMLQHIVLTHMVAPLWVAGLRHRIPSLPLALEYVYRFMTRPVIAGTLFVSGIALWHIPLFYEAALNNAHIHAAEHMVFLGLAFLFWEPLLGPIIVQRQRSSFSYAHRYGYMAAAEFVLTLLGILFTILPYPIYPWYITAPRIWEISAAFDQVLGGIVMMFGGPIFLIVVILTGEDADQAWPPAKNKRRPTADTRPYAHSIPLTKLRQTQERP